jgi:hypothetical protein
VIPFIGSIQQPTTDRPSTSATNQPTNQQPTIDLAPLVSHIATLEDQVQRLTEASTMWQIRARQAEEQLLQLTGIVPETSPEAAESLQASETEPHGFWARVRRFWSG